MTRSTPSLRPLFVLAVFSIALEGFAATYRIPSDDVLIAKAGAIVRGRVADQVSAEDAGGGIHTDTTIVVERVLKGLVASQRIVVRQPGGRVEGRAEVYPGIGSFAPDERVLLMLDPVSGTTFRLTDLALGKFTLLGGAGGRDIFRRDGLRDGFVLGGGGIPAAAANEPSETGPGGAAEASSSAPFVDPDRDAVLFERYVVARTVGLSPEPDYVRTPDDSIRVAAFEFLGSPPARWSEFDSGIHVHYTDSSAGDPGSQCVGDGCHPEVAAGMTKWNPVTGTQIFLDYDGTDATIGSKCLGALDDQISFNDPCNEIGNLSGCTGVLAVGGFSSSFASGGHPSCPAKNNPTFEKIVSGKIMVNNGTGNCLNSCDYTEMIAHETGHTIGAGHTGVPNSLMNAALNTGSGQCGTPRADDIAFAQCSYPQIVLTCDLDASRFWVGPPPQSITFDTGVSGGTAPFSYDYDFGDGTSSTSSAPTHTYAAAGTYTAGVTITGSDTQTCTDTMTITVQSCLPSNVTSVEARYSAPMWKAIVVGSGFKSGAVVQIDAGGGFVSAPVTKRKTGKKLVAKDVGAIWPAGVPVIVRVLSSTGCPSNSVPAIR